MNTIPLRKTTLTSLLLGSWHPNKALSYRAGRPSGATAKKHIQKGRRQIFTRSQKACSEILAVRRRT
mgnify:CR=1 FL=1